MKPGQILEIEAIELYALLRDPAIRDVGIILPQQRHNFNETLEARDEPTIHF